MGMILHDWNLDRKLQLIRAAFEALPPGGAFIVIENLIVDDRRENVFRLMMSLNMLIEFGDAFDFTGADFRRWCQDVGFRTVEVAARSLLAPLCLPGLTTRRRRWKPREPVRCRWRRGGPIKLGQDSSWSRVLLLAVDDSPIAVRSQIVRCQFSHPPVSWAATRSFPFLSLSVPVGWATYPL